MCSVAAGAFDDYWKIKKPLLDFLLIPLTDVGDDHFDWSLEYYQPTLRLTSVFRYMGIIYNNNVFDDVGLLQAIKVVYKLYTVNEWMRYPFFIRPPKKTASLGHHSFRLFMCNVLKPDIMYSHTFKNGLNITYMFMLFIYKVFWPI